MFCFCIKRIGFLLVLVALFGFQVRAVSGQKVVHPTQENILSNEEVDHVVSRMRDQEVGEELRAVAERFRNATEVTTIGVRNGKKNEIIGKVSDAEKENGKIYILDERNSEVKIYNTDGSFKKSIGRPGKGPREMSSPSSMEVKKNGKIVVANTGTVSIIDENSKEKANKLGVGFTITDMCLLNEKIYATGFSSSSNNRVTILELNGDAKNIGGFGERYKTDSEFVEMQLSDGYVSCNKKENMFVSGIVHLPTVEVFSDNNKEKLKYKVNDFTPIKAVKKGKGVTLKYDKKRHFVWDAFDINGDLFILQVSHSTQKSIEKNNIHSKTYTYILSYEDGKSLYVGSSLPPIYDVKSDRIITGNNYPYPKVSVFKIPKTGE